MESSPLIAAVAGGNSTVSGGADVVLDITAFDPDEVSTRYALCQSVYQSLRFNRERINTSRLLALGIILPSCSENIKRTGAMHQHSNDAISSLMLAVCTCRSLVRRTVLAKTAYTS